MHPDIIKKIKKYKSLHPEVNRIMEKFKISQKEYEESLKTMGLITEKKETYTKTVTKDYNVNVSRTNK